MSDCERLTTKSSVKKNKEHWDEEPACNEYSSKVGERDDLSGMALNMFSKLDWRSLIIIWVTFIFVHTEMFGEHILKRFANTLNEDGTMNMKGTVYASFFMLVMVIICTLVF